MKLIIGLGNPGSEYANTWHNMGFIAVDKLADEIKASYKLWGQGSNCELAQGEFKGEKILILKPLTYMNLSGQAAVAAAHYFKILPEDIIVVHDEMDLPLGDVRLKVGGGDAGHKGLKSLTQHLSTNGYARVRMGIGRPPVDGMDPVDFVLAQIKSSDWTTVDDMVQRALGGLEAFVAGPAAFTREMNKLNKRTKPKQED